MEWGFAGGRKGDLMQTLPLGRARGVSTCMRISAFAA